MRCSNRLCGKIKSVFTLIVIFSCLIPLITVINHRPSLLRPYKAVSFQITTRVPGSFLKTYKPKNASYCTFNYGLPWKFNYDETSVYESPEFGAKSTYRILYNVLEQKIASDPTNLVTYATHVSPEFISYVSEIVVNWEGPISMTAFVPDSDADVVFRQLNVLCQCLPEMSKLSVHFAFPAKIPPYVNPITEEVNTCAIKETSTVLTFRALNKMSYPVNVCRNAAKITSKTEYVLVSDVELMPSEKLASRFLHMLGKLKEKKRLKYPSHVFVVPVFEIERYEEIPKEKGKLLDLIKDEKAVYFHRHVCFHCQKFPGLQNWLQSDPGDVIKPLISVKREYPFHRWEPIYIGTKNDPLYSEVLSWEGKQDKMTQMLEMCLIGYKFVILDGAFLIHWPGIKRKSLEMKLKNKWRSPYQLKNSRQYNIIINKLSTKYAKNPKC